MKEMELVWTMTVVMLVANWDNGKVVSWDNEKVVSWVLKKDSEKVVMMVSSSVVK